MALVDSIVGQGDGKSFETAFQVISVDEEYAVLVVFGLDRVEQRLVTYNGNEFDVLTVRSRESGDEFQLFFNVDIPWKWLVQHLLDAKRSETNQSQQPAPISLD